MMNSRTLLYFLFLCAILVFSMPLHAGQNESATIDPKAEEALRQMSEYVNSLQQFTIHMENNTDMLLISGHKVQVGATVDISIRHPDRLRAEVAGDIRSQQLFYDGKSITLYGRKVNYYAIMEAPDTIEAALNHARENFALIAPAADVVLKNSYEVMTENIISGNYLGLSKVHGIECHHLLFTQDNVDWQIWIENSKTPLPRKLIIAEKWMMGGPQFTALFSDWNLSPELKDNLFTFVPPETANKIEFLPVDKTASNIN